MHSYEPFLFHKAYPLESFLEESKIIEKEKELMLSYLPKEYRQIQEKVDETCDRMEYEGSRMYDEHPDAGVIRQIGKAIQRQLMNEGDQTNSQAKEWESEQYQEDIVCCFLCNEIFRRRYRSRKGKKYIR